LKGLRSPSFSVEEVLRATGGTLIRGRPDLIFRGLSTDSRDTGSGNLFVPLTGERFDGHDFIAGAINGGAAGVLADRGRAEKMDRYAHDGVIILVDDTLRALGDIAQLWRRKFSIPVAAITGSSGKTTTKEMTAAIAGLSGKVLKSRGNFNNLVGLPLSLLEMEPYHKAAILEMGTNMKGEIKRLTEIAEPEIGVITNIGPVHLEGFGSLDSVMEEKGKLFSNMKKDGVAIINGDDERITALARNWKGEKITYGINGDALVKAENIVKKGRQGISFVLKIKGAGKMIEMSAPGNHNVYNALAAAATSLALGIENDLICRGLAEFRQIQGRMTIHGLKNGAYLIDDSYNANPDSMREALMTLRELKGKNKGIVVFGDMLELGDQSEKMHEEVGELIADTGISKIFLKGDFSRDVMKGLKKGEVKEDQIFFTESPEDMLASLRGYLDSGDWVLVKGSRKMNMERFVHSVMQEFGEKPG
jgi:UDP-N-acetylmuramoyl-tripeptide--D-alanyl-D-alanine ligase